MTFKPRTRTRARRLGGLLAGTLALGLVPLASPALASHPPARDIGDPPADSACPVFPASGTTPQTTEVPEDGFTDVPGSNVHEFAIDCVAWYEVTSGKTATTYAPDASIRRDQMATFIAQMIDYVTDRTESTSDGLNNNLSGNPFECDVNTANVHFNNIRRLAEAGVVRGTDTNSAGDACFNPDGTVTRAQMATFLREASRIAGAPLTNPTADHFVDDETSVHEDNINAIAEAGLAEGAARNTNDEDIYNPDGIVRRDQMGSFIARTLDRLIEVTNVEQPPVAAVAANPRNVPKGTELTVTSTALRGTVASITASGCGAPAKTSTATPFNEVKLMIPADRPNGDCQITVVTNFADTDDFGGEDRSETDVTTVTVINAS